MEWERDVGRMVLVLLGVLVLATAVTTANATLPGLFRGETPWSSKANQFIVGFMEIDSSVQSTIALHVTTDEDSPVGFTVALTNPSMEISGTAIYGSVTQIDLPVSAIVTSDGPVVEEMSKGVRVTAEGGKTITVYASNVNDRSSGVFLVLPCVTYPVESPQSYAIVSQSFPEMARGRSQFLVVGCDNDTAVQITPTQPITIPLEYDATPSSVGRGNITSFSLDSMQTLLVENAEDLTGTLLTADKPIAVFSGSGCSGEDVVTCHQLVEQMPSQHTWGSLFFTAPFANNRLANIFKISASSDTEINITCTNSTANATARTTESVSLKQFESFTFERSPDAFCCIESSQPILVTQTSAFGEGEVEGSLLQTVPPLQQYSNNFTLTTNFTGNEDGEHFVNIIVPALFFSNSAEDQARIRIGSQQATDTWLPIFCASDIVCGYGAQVSVGDLEDFNVYHEDPSAGIAVSVYAYESTGVHGTSAGHRLDPIAFPIVTLEFAEYVISEEEGNLTVVITRHGNMATSFRVLFDVLPVDAQGGADFLVAEDLEREIEFLPGESRKEIVVVIVNDLLPEDDEQFLIQLTQADNQSIVLSITQSNVTILSNDVFEIGLAEESYTVSEAMGSVLVGIMATVPNPGPEEVVLGLATIDTSAAVGADYHSVGQTEVFFVGEQLVEIDLEVFDDDLVEPLFEEFVLMISIHPTSRFEGVTLTRTNTTIVIRDSNTVTVELLPSSVTVLEGTAEVNVSVVKVGDTLIPVSVQVSTQESSARAGVDYGGINTEVVFAPNVTEINVTVAIEPDSVLETDESFQLILSAIPGQPVTLLRPEATISVLDDDVVFVSFEVAEVFVGEGDGTVTITVLKNGTSDIPITVNIATESIGSAIAGVDFEPLALQIVISAEASNSSVVINITDDQIAEVPERFFVVLSSVQVGVMIATPRQSAIFIVDNDNVEVGFSLSSYVVREEAGSLQLTLVKTGISQRSVAVLYSTTDGTARAPNDYIALSDVATFGPDDTMFQFEVLIVNDNRTEPPTLFSIQLIPLGAGVVVSSADTGRAEVEIIDDDGISIGFANATYTVDEGAGVVILTIEKQRPTALPTLIEYFTVTDSATAEDFVPLVRTSLTITEGALSIEVAVQLVDDTLSEPVERFFVQLELVGTQGGEVVLSQGRAEVFIEDNDGVVIMFDPAVYNVIELETNIGLRIIRQGGAESNVTVVFSTQDGSASAISGDYVPAIIELNFAPGENEKFVSVMILNDDVFEGPEVFHGLLIPISLGVAIGGTAIVTIDDSADAVAIAFELSTLTVSENEGFVSINVVKSGDNAVPVQFLVTVTEGSAKESIDFAISMRNFTLGAEDSEVSFNVTVFEDGIIENAETFEVVLSAVVGEGGIIVPKGRDRLTVTITDSTAGIAVLFGDTDITVQEDAGVVTLQVTALGLLETSLTVIVTTQDGTAEAGEDYVATILPVVFLPGDNEQLVTIPILNDEVLESEEAFSVLLFSDESSVVIPQNTTTVRIQDDDQVVLTFNPVEYSVSESEGTVQLRVEKIGRNMIPVSVSFNTADNSAIGMIVRSDYVPVSETLVFGESDTERTITVTILDDNAVEETERFFGQLAITPGGSGVTIETAISSVFIHDDDGVTVGFTRSEYTATEGPLSSLVVALVKQGESQVGVDVVISLLDGTATGGFDFNPLSQAVSFGPRDTTGFVSVQLLDDDSYEGNETFFALLEILSDFPGVIAVNNTAVITVVDDDFVSVSFAEAEYSITEDDAVVNITISRQGRASIPIEIFITTTSERSSATENADYVPVELAVLLEPEQTSFTVSIPVLEDDSVEGREEFGVQLMGGDGVTVEGATALVAIIDDDVLEIGFEQAEYFVDEGQAFAEVVLTKLGENERPVSVILSTRNGAATASLDYVEVLSSVVTFQSGQLVEMVRVSLLSDDTVEEDEDFFVQLLIPQGEMAVSIAQRNTATITILDDDNIRIGFATLLYSVFEGALTVVPVVTLEGSSDRLISLAIATLDLTASGQSDYIPIDSTLTFAPGQPVQTVTVDVLADGIAEANEVFSLQLSNPFNDRAVTLGVDAIFEVLDQDDVLVGFQDGSASVAEDGGSIIVGVFLSGEADAAISVQYSTVDGSAVAGKDYAREQGSITFSPGASQQTISIDVLNDQVLEGLESFELLLELPPIPERFILLSNTQIAIQILDDDSVLLQFSQVLFVGSEDSGMAEVCVQRVGASDLDLDVLVTSRETVSPSAQGNVDFVSADFDVAFLSTDLSPLAEQCVSIPIQDDTVALEGEESFAVELAVISQLPRVLLGNSSAVVAIQDNDLTVEIVFEQDSYTVGESSATAEVCVRKNATTARAITVAVETFETVPKSATANQDFVLETIATRLGPTTDVACAVVLILNDEVFEEEEEAFQVQFDPSASSDEDGVIFRTTQTPILTILDDEVVQVRGDDIIASEENRTARLCLQLDREIEVPLELGLTYGAVGNTSTAILGVDFDGAADTVTFQPGFQESCVEITIFADELSEGDEYFCVNIISSNSRVQTFPLRDSCNVLVLILDAGVPLPPVCRVDDSILITPFQRTAPGDLNFNFQGSCEHVLLSSCDTNPPDFAITLDFLPSDLAMGRIGIRLSEIHIIIHEDLTVSSENLGDPISSNDSLTTTYENGITVSTQEENETMVFIATLGVVVTRSQLASGANFLFINVSEGGLLVAACGLCGTLEGVLLHSDRVSVARLDDRTQIEAFADSWRVNPGEQFLREQRNECGFVGADSIVGDPLFAVTLYDINGSTPVLPKAGNTLPPALCFEIHGSVNQTFNLVSDRCTSVNALYVAMDIPDNGNIISAVGVRAIDKLGDCIDVSVSLQNDCVPSVRFGNSTLQSVERYSSNGVSVSLRRGRVRVSVPNCENVQLVMWVICRAVSDQRLIEFEITRGVNLRPTSHGLLGQFWNIPISFRRFFYNGTDPEVADTFALDRLYEITVNPVGGATSPRTFVAELYHKSWQQRGLRCYYAGTSQGGALKDLSTSSSDTVIQGTYRDYQVDGLFQTDFAYSRFDSGTCS